MPGCRDSAISVFCCAEACGAAATKPRIANSAARALQGLLFMAVLQSRDPVDRFMEMH